MKILLTGVTGYIAKRLLPALLTDGHEVICCVRDRSRFDTSRFSQSNLKIIEVDFIDTSTLSAIPKDIDVAYYLIHSMSASIGNFKSLEKISATNFKDALNKTNVNQVIYLSGIINSNSLSAHLKSRKAVEDILKQGQYKLTTLKAGIIVGSGSASFEIIRDLVEKLPIMVAPKWLNTRSQPIAIENVVQFLKGVILKEEVFGKSIDIGGPDILTYKQMLIEFAKIRNLRRRIIVVPVMTPKLSSYWLYFITSTSYKLAVNLVNSMKIEIVCAENNLDKLLNIRLIPYREAVQRAFDRIEQMEVPSSWTDALSGTVLSQGIRKLIHVPEYGCFKDIRKKNIGDENLVLEKIWSIGGKNGWYYGNLLWRIRGFMDKLFGGVGLRRGRRNDHHLSTGDALDFWRVLYASREERRLLLYAEMKLPGEAWLEFMIKDNILYQTATFRPLGLWGRIYWYSISPFHIFIFQGMINRITKTK